MRVIFSRSLGASWAPQSLGGCFLLPGQHTCSCGGCDGVQVWGRGRSPQSPGPREPAEPAVWVAWVLCQAACFSGLRGLGGLRAAPSPTLGAAASSRLPAAGAPALSSQPRSVPGAQCGTRMAAWPFVKQEGTGVGPSPQGSKSATLPDFSSTASELCGLRGSQLPLLPRLARP